MLAVLVGVLAGYFVGKLLEDRFGWQNVIMLTMPIGGVVSGVIARFTLRRFSGADDGRDDSKLRRIK